MIIPLKEPVKDGGPAFPSHGTMGEVVQEGMSLRDYMAVHAPSPEVEELRVVLSTTRPGTASTVEARWAWADQMLKGRS